MMTKPQRKINTVAIVGLGSAGLAAVKELRAAGLRPTGFDRRDEIGGLWCASNAGNTGVYKELTMNSTRSTSEFSDFPWNADDYGMRDADEEGFFANQAEAGAYLRAYAKHFDLSQYFRLSTNVTSITRSSNNCDAFIVKTVTGKLEKEEEFDAVILCNGRFNVPKNPVEEKLQNFTGLVLHSQQVASLKDFQNQRVLVIGGSVSGSDLADHLSRPQYGAKQVANSLRRPHYFLDKFTVSGPSIELAFFKRLGLWLKPYLPVSFFLAAFKSDVLKHYPRQLKAYQEGVAAEAVPDPNATLEDVACGYTSGYVKAVEKKRLVVKPDIARVKDKTVTFVDGTSQEYDTVICATGYTGLDLSMFSPELRDDIGAFVGPSGMQDVATYKRTLVADVPNLAVTKPDCFGAIFPLVEMQARYIAAVWSGRIPRPPEAQVRKGANAIRTIRLQGKYTTYDLTHEIMEELGDELGVTPTLWQALWNTSDLLLGPMYPCYYRTHVKVDGEEVAAKARERLAWCKAHPAIRRDTS